MTAKLTIAGLYGAAGVAAAAFGAHALPDAMRPALRHAFETGADFHLLHAVLLAALALAGERLRHGAAFWIILAGSALFSASLYTLALSGVGAFGAVTPVGGVMLIAGWLALARAGLKRS